MSATKKVVLQLTIEVIVQVPPDWKEKDINFYHNDSSHCSGNEFQVLAELAKIDNDILCACAWSKFKYVRDATGKDLLLPDLSGR